MEPRDWPLFEVFVRPRNGLGHRHVGSLHAADPEMALTHARDLYSRRGEAASLWVVEANAITASQEDEAGILFDPADDKIYRHPSFYPIEDDVGNM